LYLSPVAPVNFLGNPRKNISLPHVGEIVNPLLKCKGEGMDQGELKRVLRSKAAPEYLGVSPKKLYDFVEAGKIAHVSDGDHTSAF
jgi:hypothetical protein